VTVKLWSIVYSFPMSQKPTKQRPMTPSRNCSITR
jgi:hypothetical protein